MGKESKPREIPTPEERAKMTLPEKVKRYAEDVMETENNPEKGEYIYSFLFGGGSLGYFLTPTIIGEGVLKVAELTDTEVSFIDFTLAKFEKKINKKAVRKAFYPILKEFEAINDLPQSATDSERKQHIEQARIALSKISKSK